jgi:hypothetical protein
VVNSPTFGHVIMFFPDVAFSAAQDAYPDMIQHGQQSSIAWSSLWDEGLTPKDVKRQNSGAGTPINTWKNQGIRGVPVTVKTLLRSDHDEDLDGNEDNDK